jgi:hypothetical protein
VRGSSTTIEKQNSIKFYNPTHVGRELRCTLNLKKLVPRRAVCVVRLLRGTPGTLMSTAPFECAEEPRALK